MTRTRRDFLTTAVTAAGAAVTPHLATPHEQSHDHDHQVVPSFGTAPLTCDTSCSPSGLPKPRG